MTMVSFSIAGSAMALPKVNQKEETDQGMYGRGGLHDYRFRLLVCDIISSADLMALEFTSKAR